MQYVVLIAIFLQILAPTLPTRTLEAAGAVNNVEQTYLSAEKEMSRSVCNVNAPCRLKRLYTIDQAGHSAIDSLDLRSVPAAERQNALNIIGNIIYSYDLAAQSELKSLIPRVGWFSSQEVGEVAAMGAFLVVQHAANDPGLMREALRRMKEGPLKGRDGMRYAYLYDRVSLDLDHKSQKFGTQISCIFGQWKPVKLEEPDKVDVRRRMVGISETESAYLMERTQSHPCPKEQYDPEMTGSSLH